MIYYDIDCERALISSCISSKERCGMVLSELSSDDIYSAVYKVIFEAISEVFNSTGDSTLLTVRAKLIEKSENEALAALMKMVSDPAVINIQPIIDTVKMLGKRRSLYNMMKCKMNEDKHPDEISGEIINDILEINKSKRKEVSQISEIIESRIIDKTGYLPMSSWINTNIRGCKRGNFVVIGARPHTGKTVNVVDMARICARKHNVLFFTLEQREEQIARMILTQISGIPTDAIQDDCMSEAERSRLTSAKKEAACLNIKIIDRIREISKIATIIRTEAMSRKVDFVFIDYLQRIYAVDRKQQRHLQIGEVCKTLKDIADDLDLCMVVPCQLSRGSELGKEPSDSDLKESGSIEEDADVIFLMWRPEEGEKTVRVKCVKNRNNGIFFKTDLHFDTNYLQFHEITENRNFNEI